MAWTTVTFEGFTVNNQTWDNALQLDGKGDEVFLLADIRLVDTAGNQLLGATKRSATMGDTNGFPYRVRAGSASSLGGLRTGDEFPYPDPWQRQGPLHTTYPPTVLFQQDITGDRGVVITPVLWEWDGGVDLFNAWGQSLVNNGPNIVAATMNIINAFNSGSPLPADAVKSALDLGLPSLFTLLNDIIGQAKDRPIGMQEQSGGYSFTAKSIVLTSRMVDLVTQTDFGYGNGVIGLEYQEANRLAGDYMLYFKVDKLALTDGLVLKEVSAAPVYVIFGGAKFWIPNPTVLQSYGGWAAVTTVPDGALASVPAVPRDGTVLREMSSAPVYVIQNGKKCWIPDANILQKYGGWTAVRVVPDGGLAQIPDGPQAT